jgi:hypothetical protein
MGVVLGGSAPSGLQRERTGEAERGRANIRGTARVSGMRAFLSSPSPGA